VFNYANKGAQERGVNPQPLFVRVGNKFWGILGATKWALLYVVVPKRGRWIKTPGV